MFHAIKTVCDPVQKPMYGVMRAARIFIVLWLTLSGIALAQSDPATTPESENDGLSAQTDQKVEEQVRRVLLDILEKDLSRSAETSGENTGDPGNAGSFAYSENVLSNWAPTETNMLASRLRQLKNDWPQIGTELKSAFALATSPAEGVTGFSLIITITLLLASGFLIEYFITRPLLFRLNQYATSQEKTIGLKVKYICARLIIQVLGLLIFGFATYSAALFFIKKNLYFENLFLEILNAFIFFRFSILVVRNILSPYFEPLRLINLDSSSAKRLYYLSVLFFAVYATTGMLTQYLLQTNMSKLLISGLLIPTSMILNSIILFAVWRLRERITAMFVDETSTNQSFSFSGRFFKQFWPFFFTIWLTTIWLLWLYRILQGQPEMARGVTIAWVITLAFPILDRLFNGLLKNIVKIPWLQSPAFENRSSRFIRIVQGGFRIILLSIAIFTLLHSWDVNATSMMTSGQGRAVGEKVVDFLFIATLAYVFWELMHALIERKLPEDEGALASLEGDGGGAGASREETLLPLVRTTLTVILAIVFTLSLLHAAGIAITPLLAGAGVVGIAVGFGAQKLVQDILSGVFFLIDDAFRKGEYIEMENLRGTVEKISLRSMQLRHHLGAVQTIPYSEIKTVTNLSRDWITMKLELRLPYETDIEKVRKIIKKVGQEMMKNDEMGPSFILPLKSQGVLRMEESALIVRMKFTSRPGEQWIIRREAYRRVRDALADAGIHFAHREVRVVMPEEVHSPNGDSKAAITTEQKSGEGDSTGLQKAAAAAITSVLAAESIKDRSDDDSSSDSDDR